MNVREDGQVYAASGKLGNNKDTECRAGEVKYLKWTALILIVLAIIAAVVVQWRRDAIALEIANRVLKDTDFIVASISVRALGADHIELSTVVLETPDGTQYDVEGLYFPLTGKGAGPRSITIQSLTISNIGEQPQATSYVDLARAFLALPDTLANTDVRVQHMSIPALPALSKTSWTTAGQGQTIAVEVAGLAVNVAVTRSAGDTYEARIAASDALGSDVLLGTLAFSDTAERVGVDGNVHIDLVGVDPLLRKLEWLPTSAELNVATIDGAVAVDLDADGEGTLAIRFVPALSKGASIDLRGEDGAKVGLVLDDATSLDIALGYPSLDWTLDTQQVNGTLLLDDGSKVTTTVRDVHCVAGVVCTLSATARTGPLAWGDISVKAINVDEASGIALTVADTGWSATVRRAPVAIKELRPADELLASMSFVVSDLQISNGTESIDAWFRSAPGTGEMRIGDLYLPVPGTEGTLEVAGDTFTSSLRLFDKAQSLGASIGIDYDLEAASGKAMIREGFVDFGRRKLSQRIAAWSYPWDVVAGKWVLVADLEWTAAPDGMRYRGQSTHRIEGLAGFYNDIGMAGMATTLTADIDSTKPMLIEPATIRIELIDVGVPIKNVTADVALDAASLAATVNALSGAVVGGRFSIDPFTYSYSATRNDLQVHLERVQPQFMVDLAEFENLKITGTMSGMLPVAIIENAVRIENGRLTNDPPGGVIRYKGADAAAGASSNAQLAVVTGALSNFVYNSLTARVDYTETGDLKLGMRLEGTNPDRDPTQPIILNLNVDNNIPQMLRSLQAVRSIEDILERRAVN